MADFGTINVVISIATGLMALAKTISDNRVVISEVKKKMSNKSTMVINEFEGDMKNELYEVVEIYLGNNPSSQKCKIKACMTETEKEKNLIKVTLEPNEKMKDFYDGHKFKWILLEFPDEDLNSVNKSEVKYFNLTYQKEDYDFVRHTYLPYIIKEAKCLKYI